MSATSTHIQDQADGITRVDLQALIALRARAGKPRARVTRVHTAVAGANVSALRGRGMDYAESRVYQPGDDARNIDWRRTARSGKWHTKLFQAEREHSQLLLVDTHPTMRFGTRARYKSVAAARAAAWLAWTLVRGGDRVGAMAFGGLDAAVGAHAGTRGALAVLGALAHWDAQSPTVGESGEPLSAALMRAQRMAAHGSGVWLLSDGWCKDAGANAALARLARSVDLRVVILVDPLERSLAPAGSYVFETASGKRRAELVDARSRAQLRDRLANGWRGLVTACDAVSVPWTALATTDEPGVSLAALMRKRARGRRG
ncbi:MAG TPA: DUF58 domain-containing protein [Rhodanobacteraceae bacterium]|nr:DUF58 domain-containing protein [Rhodanobacteraceae bacterium]